MKIVPTKTGNSMDEVNHRLDRTKERNNKLGNGAVKITPIVAQEGKESKI